MPRSLLIAALALAAAPAAAADFIVAPPPHGVAAAFGNTVKALYPDGRYERLWLHPDGHWEAVGRRGFSSAGKWAQHDDRVCLRQTRPFPAPFHYCTEFPLDGGIGAVWSGHDWQGEPIRLTVVPGIERP